MALSAVMIMGTPRDFVWASLGSIVPFSIITKSGRVDKTMSWCRFGSSQALLLPPCSDALRIVVRSGHAVSLSMSRPLRVE